MCLGYITFGSVLTWASRIWHFQNTWSPVSTKANYTGHVCRDEGTGDDIPVSGPVPTRSIILLVLVTRMEKNMLLIIY